MPQSEEPSETYTSGDIRGLSQKLSIAATVYPRSLGTEILLDLVIGLSVPCSCLVSTYIIRLTSICSRISGRAASTPQTRLKISRSPETFSSRETKYCRSRRPTGNKVISLRPMVSEDAGKHHFLVREIVLAIVKVRNGQDHRRETERNSLDSGQHMFLFDAHSYPSAFVHQQIVILALPLQIEIWDRCGSSKR